MQTQQYTLTNRIMGDPRPDRFAVSERQREKQKVRVVVNNPAPRCPRERRGKIEVTLGCVNEGHNTARLVTAHTGWRLGTVMDYLRRLVADGLVSYHEATSPIAQGGIVRIYKVTDAGLKKLSEAVE